MYAEKHQYLMLVSFINTLHYHDLVILHLPTKK